MGGCALNCGSDDGEGDDGENEDGDDIGEDTSAASFGVRLPEGDDESAAFSISAAAISAAADAASTAATGPVPTRIDELQGTHQQGPCLQTIREHTTVRVKDFGSETRWPSFVEDLIVQTPVRSALSVLLYTEDSELGALNLYAEEAGVFDDSVEDMAVALGAHAAIALSAAGRSEQFHSALFTRDVIGQAKGIIMERYRIGAGAAFELLTRLSQDTNTPLAQIAQELVQADFPPADS